LSAHPYHTTLFCLPPSPLVFTCWRFGVFLRYNLRCWPSGGQGQYYFRTMGSSPFPDQSGSWAGQTVDPRAGDLPWTPPPNASFSGPTILRSPSRRLSTSGDQSWDVLKQMFLPLGSQPLLKSHRFFPTWGSYNRAHPPMNLRLYITNESGGQPPDFVPGVPPRFLNLFAASQALAFDFYFFLKSPLPLPLTQYAIGFPLFSPFCLYSGQSGLFFFFCARGVIP